MKAFRLMMMAGLLAFAGAANADEVTVLTANVEPGEGTYDLVVDMDFDTQETLVGWNFSLTLPDGIDFNTAKTTSAARKKCCEFGEIIDEDVASEGLTIQERAEGGYLFNWIDQGDKTPLLGTKGMLITINLKAENGATGEGKIFNIGLANNLDQGFATFGKGDTIKDVTFQFGGETGINEVKAAQENGAIYNVAGQRLDKAAKGLYIQNGKKYVK